MFNISKSTNAMQPVNGLKDRNHMFISIDTGKTFEHPLEMKALNKL